MKKIKLAANLLRLRRDYKITQEELANFLGVTKASVSKWENAQSYPDIVLLPKIASYFNCSIDELLGYEAQMSKERIKSCYHELAASFAKLPFEEAMVESQELVKEYYSCYPFLIQVVILWLNHVNLAKTKQRQTEVYRLMQTLCERILTESDNAGLCSDAVVLKAMIQMQCNEVTSAIENLEELMNPNRFSRQSDSLLIQAYMMNGETDKAEKSAQINLLLNILGVIANGSSLFALYQEDTKKAEQILERMEQVIAVFSLDHLHPNSTISMYYQAALFYGMKNNREETLDKFKKMSVGCIAMMEGNVCLHGDSFFTKLDDWFLELDLGVKPVRNVKLILADMKMMIENPVFSVIRDSIEYRNFQTYLDKQIKEEQ